MFNDFKDSRRTEATRRTYEGLARMLVPDPDAFAGLARRDRKAAEDMLIGAMVERREKLSPASTPRRLHQEGLPFGWLSSSISAQRYLKNLHLARGSNPQKPETLAGQISRLEIW